MTLAFKHAIAAIILVMSFAGSVAAGPLEDADVAVKRRDYATAVRLIRPLAEQGDATAQYNLGGLLRQWLGRPARPCQRIHVVQLVGSAGQRRCSNFSRPRRTAYDPAQIAEAQKLAREWKPKPEQ